MEDSIQPCAAAMCLTLETCWLSTLPGKQMEVLMCEGFSRLLCAFGISLMDNLLSLHCEYRTYSEYTDDTLRETVVHGSQAYPFAFYPENIWEFDFHRIDWHWHHELEFLFVDKGTAICFAGDNRIELSEGTGIFINSGTLHQYEAKSSAFCPNIVFDATLLAPEDTLIYEKYVNPILHSSVAFQVLQPDVAWQYHILETLNQIFSVQEIDGGNELRTMQLLLQCWDVLYQNMNMDSISPAVRRLNHRQAKLQTMMQYIHNHYKEAITLDMIANSVPA